VVEVTRPVFEKMAYREGPDGWLAVVPSLQRRLGDLTLSPNPLLVVAEAVEKPGNLGALLRSADAAGWRLSSCVTLLRMWATLT